MLALGPGMIAWIMTLGAGLGLAGGWFGFRWRHKGRVFSESDREYFQNLLYRAETAEGKLEQMEPELARTSDRANILEDSHRVIQEELANERQFNLSLNVELSRERAHRKFLESRRKRSRLNGVGSTANWPAWPSESTKTPKRSPNLSPPRGMPGNRPSRLPRTEAGATSIKAR